MKTELVFALFHYKEYGCGFLGFLKDYCFDKKMFGQLER